MGALGCKYCNCDREKLEEASDEMKIQYKEPIDISNERNGNDKGYDIKNNDDLNINIEINNDINKIVNQNPLDNSSQHKNGINSKNNENNIKPIIESNIIFQKSTFNNDNNNINNENNFDNNIDNNPSNYKFKKNNVNEEFIIEENKLNIKKNNNEKKENNLKESQTSQFSITNTKDAKNKIKKYEINKIQFGLEKEDKENLNKEQQILYNEAENNLQQFYAPQGNEINQLQTVMGNILFKLKNIFLNIDLNSNKDEQENILLNGNLKKMINYEINAHKTTMYSERFCILYPKMLKYYKSKVQFLKNLKPLCVLPVNQISAVNIAKPKKSKNKIYHLIICNKLGIKKNINNNVFLNLFDSTEINDYLSSPDLNESLLIFTSDDEQNIYKWYIIIQYLIEFINSKN